LRGPVILLTGIIAGNALVRVIGRRAGLTQSELVLLYIMLTLSTAIGGVGMVQFLVPTLAAPFYFATPENGWGEFLPLIPSGFAVRDPEVLKGFFQGNSTLYDPRVLRAWAGPVLLWSVFLMVLILSMLCACVLVRQRWTDHERLSFPLVLLPMQMATGGPAFWRNRIMWAGFAIAGILESINYINWLYPSFPYVQLKPYSISQFITQRPWSGIAPLWLAFYPFAIGIGFLLSLDISFSCWFTYLLIKSENVVAIMLGFRDPGAGVALARAPYIAEQGAGAYLGMGLFILWSMRRHLRDRLFSPKEASDGGEVIPYRLALIGLGVCFAAMAIFFRVMGLPLWAGTALLVLYLLSILTVSRLVAEAGTGWTLGSDLNAHGVINVAAGTGALQPKAATTFASLLWFDLDYRDSPMPHQLEGTRMASLAGITPRLLLAAILVAMVVGIAAAFWSHLDIYYRYGAASARTRPWVTSMGQQPWVQLGRWLRNPAPPDLNGLLAVGAGAGIVSILAGLRQRYLWWPLHPVGYVLGNTPSMVSFWCPFFVAWLAKLIILRVGGIRLYRRCIPFALGLILGDYVVPGIWGIVGLLTDTQMYLSFPW